MVAITHPNQVSLVRPLRRPTPVVYRRRRLAVLGLVLVVLSLASAALHLLGPGPTDAGVRPVAAVRVVVEPGDTVWSLAAEVAPGADPRPVVDAIVEANGGSVLVAGQSLELVVP